VNNGTPVFDPHGKPWVNPDAADADFVASVVARCPSGALQFERTDAGAPEESPDKNQVRVWPDGPLFLTGDIVIENADGSVAYRETRLALCRCGASQNKPFCDNSHIDSGFSSEGTLLRNTMRTSDELTSGPLRIKLAENGPVISEGPVEIVGADAEVHTGVRGAFCRCGQSQNKPYCDGTHKTVGFVAD
jgi:CDGSH-type Zn-finger protein